MEEEVLDQLSLVYATEDGAVFQCDASETYVLKFFDEEIRLRPCAFIAFKKKIQSIDIAALLTGDQPELEIISMPHCERLFVFDVWQILQLRDLVGGAFTMLSLNSLIHRQLVRTI